MALRVIDNALPVTTPERPKKQAKVSAPIQTPNDENNPPLPHTADYVLSEDLQPLSDPDSKIQGVVQGFDSKDWIKVCEALNDARRLALHHSSLLESILPEIMVGVIKAMKNPRSALCKSSIMASSDIFKAFGEKLLQDHFSDALDAMLLQLLLKASQDKRFVCEEADSALSALTDSISALPLLLKLSAYVGHRNLRVRAKAAVSISACVCNMDSVGMEKFGMVRLVQMSGDLLNDKLPEAREAARSIVTSVYEAFTENIEEKQEAWQSFCHNNFSAVHAQSIIKIVS